MNQISFKYFDGVDLFAIEGMSHSTILSLMSEIGPEGFKRTLYEEVHVHKNVYPLLLTDHLKTQKVRSVFFIRSDWKEHFPQQASQLINVLRQEREVLEQSVY